jgi:hypothetical protein
MKISLAGPSYTSKSVVAATQETINWYPETLAAGDEPRRQVLIGRPGLKLFATLSPAKIRCLWAGGGRLFAIHGNKQSEITEAGTITTASQTVAESTPAVSPDPAQIFSNGHQLMIVSGGLVYVNNGAGPEPARFTVFGMVDTDGSVNVYWTPSGATPETSDKFNALMVGQLMRIGDIDYLVTSFINDAVIAVSSPVPAGSDLPYSVPRSGDQVTGVTGGFLDGYGITNRPPNPPGPGVVTRRLLRNRAGVEEPADPGRQFNISDINDFTVWNPLDFGVKEGHSDYIRSILCDHEELWLLGTETTEIWSNVGDPNFPFQRMGGAFIHEGSVSTYAPCSVALGVCALAGSPNGQTVAYMARGLQPQRISTFAQEQAWNAPGFNARDAVSYSYLDAGHLFWVVNFWAQQQTWVYDVTENLWHQRYGFNPSPAPGAFIRYQPWYHVFIPEWGQGGKHIVGDPSTGKLYEQSLDFYDDDGVPIQYIRTFPHLLDEDRYLFHHRFELYMETGTVVAPNPEMAVALDWSSDRGHTFPTGRTVTQTSGLSGNYSKRIVWRRLGCSRDRVYRIGVQGKAKVALTDAFLEATPSEIA